MDPSLSLNACDQRKGKKPSLLRSTQKAPTKPWKRPTPPSTRVYVVHPSGFLELVQRLTAEPKFTSKRLQQLAPPSLNLFGQTPLQPQRKRSSAQLQLHFPAEPMKHTDRSFDLFRLSSPPSCGSIPLLSPLLSPRTMALLDQDTVL